MREIKDYKIIESRTKEDLEEQVKEKLEEGYILKGGLCMAQYGNNYGFFQAMELYRVEL